jgi:hypothetical protein
VDKLEIGKVYEGFINGQEGISCKFSPAGFDTLISFNKPNSTEVDQIKNGAIDIRMLVKNDVLFILFKFGTLEYMDCPILKITDYMDVIEKITDDHAGYAMQIILADVPGGEVKVLRLIGLDNKFSKSFYKLSKVTRRMEIAEFEHIVRKVQNTYSTKELLKLCVYRQLHPGK